ncbi:tonoplast dicarboxylate transporter [Selaginella moellendorffii]|uniref:tonoplast dicarboxylate transporter n=1 Tax=Selaginella moellendorffii TaxID=88036 RepID=UPI000D1C4909|nr:tonoplast dicarboxylate transporter [Selaginella moellendorffii]|eukprot:XP_024545831.1 tonoplast dicarboxylate transporter [Selaginella moellendorffii]
MTNLDGTAATVALLIHDPPRRELDDDLDPGKSKTSRSIVGFLHGHRKDIAIALGPLCALLILAFVRIDGAHEESSNVSAGESKIAPMLAILAWVCIWWITEAIPVGITSMLPLVLLPLFQIIQADEIARAYMNDTITLFIGSFILALGVERYQAHKRLALKTLLLFGGRSMAPRMLLLGFCVGPAFISMWISNSATAIMMVPMSAGVIKRLLEPDTPSLESIHVVDVDPQAAQAVASAGDDPESRQEIRELLRRISSKALTTLDGRTLEQGSGINGATAFHARQYARAIVLGIGFSVSIGGLTTLTGTGTNLVFLGIWNSCFPSAAAVSYLQWFMFAFPLGVAMVLFCWIMLCVCYCPRSATPTISSRLNRSSIEEELKSLGSISFAETTVLTLFVVLAVLWLTRSLGTSFGWGRFFHGYVDDGTVSVVMAVFLFVIPNRLVPGERLLDWSHCKKLPWDIVLLFGGGFALAAGFKASGLSAWVTQHLNFLDNAPYLLLAPVVAVFVSATTEFTSNNATATIFLPLLANAATSNNIHPLLLMITGTIAASFAFMLPVSTPPMAVAFSTGHVRMPDMVLTGFLLKLVGILLLFALMPTLGSYVFHLNAPFVSVLAT